MKNAHLITLLNRWMTNPYLTAIRDGLTLTLPVIVAGTFAILINGFPLDAYQDFMASLFGEEWRLFGGYIYNGTFSVLAVIMALSIGHSLCEDYNAHNPLDKLSPSIFSFVVFSCVMATMEPVAGVAAFQIRWLGVHGLLLAIVVAVISSYLLRFFLRFERLRITIHSNSNSVVINQALGTMLPAVLTISVFAAYKVILYANGIADPNQAFYDFLSHSFSELGGQTLWAANFYDLIRHLLWFLGIHGSNVLEPIMQEVYVSALNSNIILHDANVIDPRVYRSFWEQLQDNSSPYAIFTKPFFDCYTSMGGAGCTLGLLIACLLKHQDASARKVARISILPSLFNINEILLFGLPVILNPIFLIPLVMVPIVTTTTAYYANYFGLVPVTIHDVAWNIPIFIDSYLATDSISGPILQAINLLLAVLIYLPFVNIDNEMRARRFERSFQKLVKAAIEGDVIDRSPKLTSRPPPVGNLAMSLGWDLGHALRKQELFMEYQPQVDSDTGKVYGVESLMRWNHPQIGSVPPSVFIAIAEDTGFILELGDWGLSASLAQLSQWRQQGLRDVVMSVNVSALQLEDAAFPERVMTLLKFHDIPMECVKFEITESIALTSQMAGNSVLARLHELGIPLAIDDFGMGHSSIIYLKQFPVSSLKIDAILSKDVLVNRSSCEIISSVADLCRSLQIDLVVEFVEDEAHLQKIRSLGCTNIQGYFYSPPLSGNECFDFIRQKHKAYGSIDDW